MAKTIVLMAVEMEESATLAVTAENVADRLLAAKTLFYGAKPNILGATFWSPRDPITPERLNEAVKGKDNWGSMVHAVDYLVGLGLLLRAVGQS